MQRLPLALAISLATISLSHAGDNTVDVPCGPISEMKDADKYRVLSRDEWEASRILFFMAKDTPASLPPGDLAMIRENNDDTASIVYVDGDEACAPMRISKEGVDILKQIRAGVVTHPKGRM